MALNLPETRLYARQIALPAVGTEGQERLRAARIVVFRETDGPDAASETAVAYLRAAGVGAVTEVTAPPPDAEATAAWRHALAGASLGLRFAFDDDALLSAALEAELPLVLGRVGAAGVELLALRHHGGCKHPRPARPAARADQLPAPGAAATVLATLAAAEALWMLIDPAREPAARLLRLALDGSHEPACAPIPWPPACSLCALANRGAPAGA